MAIDTAVTNIYHITHVGNLASILEAGGLLSDVALGQAVANREVIGYEHIKRRRMYETRVPCCANRCVGEFVPFHYCPRSPMLYTINRGNTGLPPGCQQTILHLVSTVADAIATGQPWAISDGNAAARYTSFYADTAALEDLNWDAINTRQWSGRTNEKMAEFLVADRFPWTSIGTIGCHNAAVADRVRMLLRDQDHKPEVRVMTGWYY